MCSTGCFNCQLFKLLFQRFEQQFKTLNPECLVVFKLVSLPDGHPPFNCPTLDVIWNIKCNDLQDHQQPLCQQQQLKTMHQPSDVQLKQVWMFLAKQFHFRMALR